jgi:hypothetical protein
MRLSMQYWCSACAPVPVLQEAKQLAEHWRLEAEQQRHSAASARAPETARSIKLLQDSKLAADEALLQKERALLQVGCWCVWREKMPAVSCGCCRVLC